MKYNFYFLRLLLLSPWPWDTSEDFLFSFLSSFWSFFWAVRFIDFLWRSVVRDLPEDDGRPNLAEHQGRFHGWRNLSHFSRISTAQSRHQMGESPPAPSPVHSISYQYTPPACPPRSRQLYEEFLNDRFELVKVQPYSKVDPVSHKLDDPLLLVSSEHNALLSSTDKPFPWFQVEGKGTLVDAKSLAQALSYSPNLNAEMATSYFSFFSSFISFFLFLYFCSSLWGVFFTHSIIIISVLILHMLQLERILQNLILLLIFIINKTFIVIHLLCYHTFIWKYFLSIRHSKSSTQHNV